VASKAPPAAVQADPDLRHRHPKGLQLVTICQHHVGDFGVEDSGVAHHHDFSAGQGLRPPNRVTFGVSADVLRAVEGLTDVRGPSELLVQEFAKALRIARRKGGRPVLSSVDDLLRDIPVRQPDT